MTPGATDDAHRDPIACLTTLVPDATHAEAVRLRCHARLDRYSTPARQTHRSPRFARTVVPLLLGALSAFYAAALLDATLRIEAWLR